MKLLRHPVRAIREPRGTAAADGAAFPRDDRPHRRLGTVAFFIAGFVAAVAAAFFTGGAASPALAATSCPNEAVRAELDVQRLPDCRAYEQVSPPKKNGNEAGIETHAEEGASSVSAGYGASSPQGNRIAYSQVGPFGETSSGADFYSVSTRGASGWRTSAVVPPPSYETEFLHLEPKEFMSSADLSRFLFVAGGSFRSEVPPRPTGSSGLYRAGENDPTDPPEAEWWLSKPTVPFDEADPVPGNVENTRPQAVGGSPDFSDVYFTWRAALVPEDASRAANLSSGSDPTGPSGFYEWHEGQPLRSAGELPDGSYSPFGAVPAATQTSEPRTPSSAESANEVSADGTKAFFISPQPQYANEAGTPTELYVREQTPSGPKTVLISRDELNGGEPAAGSGGEEAVTPTGPKGAYVYASPDGSKAFFESEDKLAKNSSGTEEPTGAGPWMYEFDAEAEAGRGEVTWLPEAEGQILTASENGSRFLLLEQEAVNLVIEEYEERSEEYESREETWVIPTSIDLWEAGSIKQVASWPAPGPIRVPPEGSPDEAIEKQLERPGSAYAARDGDAFAFASAAPLSDGTQSFNNTSGKPQIYRYELSGERLTCVSCAPPGSESAAALSGGASMIADEGQRIFFTSASPLTGEDVNEVDDVYEWEQNGAGSCAIAEDEGGCLSLISSGQGSKPSFYLDSGESGADVFFATAEGLVPEDTDGAYDVYDARVDGGFGPGAGQSGCAGDACQGAAGQPPSTRNAGTTAASGPRNVQVGCSLSDHQARRLDQRARRLRHRAHRLRHRATRMAPGPRAHRLRHEARVLRIRARGTAEQSRRDAKRCRGANRRAAR